MKKPMFLLALIAGVATLPGCDIHIPFTGSKAAAPAATPAAPVAATTAPAPVPVAVVVKPVAPAPAPAVAKPAPAKPVDSVTRTVTFGEHTMTVTVSPPDKDVAEQMARHLSGSYAALVRTRARQAAATRELAVACAAAIEAARLEPAPPAGDVDEELKRAKAELADVEAKLTAIKAVAKTAAINPPAFAEATPAEPLGPGGGIAK